MRRATICWWAFAYALTQAKLAAWLACKPIRLNVALMCAESTTGFSSITFPFTANST